MLPELSRQFLFKHLLTVTPSVGAPGRRSVHIMSSSPMTPYFTPTDKAYIILKRVTVPPSARWPNAIQHYMKLRELYYINGILIELMNEETNLAAENLQLQVIQDPGVNDSDTASSSCSSFPIA